MINSIMMNTFYKHIYTIFSCIFGFLLLLGILSGSWQMIYLSFLMLCIVATVWGLNTFAPFTIPVEFNSTIVLFLIATLILGEYFDYYEKLWWWDALMHVGSAFAFGLIGFIIMYIIFKSEHLSRSATVAVLFVFSFSIAIGAVWEIMEFTIDQIAGTNMQKNGLSDTMWDLIVDALGALIASYSAYRFMKFQENSFAKTALDMVNDNN